MPSPLSAPVFVPYYHRLGPASCGYLAFSVYDGVSAPQLISGIALRRADGGVVRFADRIRCTTCGRLVTHPAPLPEGASEVDV